LSCKDFLGWVIIVFFIWDHLFYIDYPLKLQLACHVNLGSCFCQRLVMVFLLCKFLQCYAFTHSRWRILQKVFLVFFLCFLKSIQ